MANQFVHGLSETVTPSMPKFESDGEFLAWAFKNLSEAIKNLNERCNKIEEGMQKIPPPGPDMIKYKIPGDADYSNLLQLFDNLFDRQDRSDKLDGGLYSGDREVISSPNLGWRLQSYL